MQRVSVICQAMNRKKYAQLVTQSLHEGNYWRASRMLWPWLVINHQTERIWKTLALNPMVCVMGHASASKTFTSAAFFLLDWWANPLKTATAIISVTKVALRARAWSDFTHLVRQARVHMPGTLIDSRMIIRAQEGDDRHAVQCIAADDPESTSKIQGLHTERVRMMIDEADNPHTNAAWSAITNLQSSGDFRLAALANPWEISSEFARNCEPVNGWKSINIDTDKEWDSFMGKRVIRLDGLDSPNIKAGRDIFPFLLTNKAVENIKHDHGEKSKEWFAFVRAWYHQEGTVSTFFTPEIISQMLQPLTFYSRTVKIAAMDPAFDGGDECIVMLGSAGYLAANPRRSCFTIDNILSLKRKDLDVDVTIDLGRQARAVCEAHGVDPEHFACEGSGTSLRMVDFLRNSWSKKFLVVPFHGSPSDVKILEEDSKLPTDRFDRKVSELWWAAREWARASCVSIRTIERQLRIDLEARTYDTLNRGIIRAETKEKMKKRGFNSPDRGDALTIMVELVRKRLSNLTHTAIPPKDKAQAIVPAKRHVAKPLIRSSFRQNYGVPDR